MESSEDDAGAATNASCRVSARERDMGDVDATTGYQQDSLEARMSCGTPGMSDLDNDSVPSPSAQDVNTSTEAILDMIDEFVDGPGAPKRLPLPTHEVINEELQIVVNQTTDQQDLSIGDSDRQNSQTSVLTPDTATINVVYVPPPVIQQQDNSPVELSTESVSSLETSQTVSITTECVSEIPEPHVDSTSPAIETSNSESELSKRQNLDNESDSYSTNVDPVLTVNSVVESDTEPQISPVQDNVVKSVPPITGECMSSLILDSDKTVPNVDVRTSELVVDSKPEITVSSECQQSVSSPVPSVSKQTNEIIPSPSEPAAEMVVCKSPLQIVAECESASDIPAECKSATLIAEESASVTPVEAECVSMAEECASDTPIVAECEPDTPKVVEPDTKIVTECASITPIAEECASDTPIVAESEPNTPIVAESDTPIVAESDTPIVSACASVTPLVEECESIKCVTESESAFKNVTECESGTETVVESNSAAVSVESVVEAQKDCSSSVETVNETPIECQNPIVCENVPETLARCSPCNEQPINELPEPVVVAPSSSAENTSSLSSQLQQRTVKCDTSSAIRESVSIENTEPTSSDTKFEEKSSSPVGKSPLRRRLVRPAPSDRKPDSTVSSSTMDSQASDTTTKEQESSECVAKSVSSSSDTVEPFQDTITREVLSNVNEISICKAETSSPIKKIKLIRQKTTSLIAATSSSNSLLNEREQLDDQEPCQSTSDSLIISPSKHTELKKLIENDTTPPDHKLDDDVNSKSNQPDPPADKVEEISSEDKSIPDLPLLNEAEIKTDEKKVPPLKLNLAASNTSISTKTEELANSELQSSSSDVTLDEPAVVETTKQVPKLTIKLGSIQQEEIKSPIPKLTIKPIQPPPESNEESEAVSKEQIPLVTKINIKPIKPPIKISEIHRKSSSSEISESESSETDETSTSDQASASDQGAPDVVPKVTIKVGKPGTTIEGKFYTQQNVPKLTIKNIQQNENEEQEPVSKLKLVISQQDEKQQEKIPKLTIKTVTGKCEGQPISPKLTIKPIPPPNSADRENADQMETQPIPKLKISTESFASISEVKENMHVPKITIKPVTRSDSDLSIKGSKKSLLLDNSDHIPAVTKLNIKPIVKPESNEVTEKSDDKVPTVSKLTIKPIIKPNEVEDAPKVAKINIRIPRNPGENSLEAKDCDEWNANCEENAIPVVTKLNIKPIVKPQDEDSLKDSENQSSETGNSSDDNTDSIPVVTKINIKPILKPNDVEYRNLNDDEAIPVVTKLNIKPVVKPEQQPLSSPKKVNLKATDIPIITKLNIKPVMKPEEIDMKKKESDEHISKNPPLVMKINMKAMAESAEESTSSEKKSNHIDEDSGHTFNNIGENIPVVSKLNIKPIPKPIEANKDPNTSDRNIHEMKTRKSMNTNHSMNMLQQVIDKSVLENFSKQNFVSSEEPNILMSKGLSFMNEVSDKIKGNLLTTVKSLSTESTISQNIPSIQNCTLLKKLLETKSDTMDNKLINDIKLRSSNSSPVSSKTETAIQKSDIRDPGVHIEKVVQDHKKEKSKTCESNDISYLAVTTKSDVTLENCHSYNDSVTKPLEISISDKITNQSSGQDSPRIILKINKTDHGPAAKIITEEIRRSESPQAISVIENTQEFENDKDGVKKELVNSRRKATPETSPSMPVGKRLRSSRVVKETDKTPVQKRGIGKRPSTPTLSSPTKDQELSVLESKRLKLGQLLSNKSLTVSPVVTMKDAATSPPPRKPRIDVKESEKTVNHSMLNNENLSKNGNSKLHNILSNLHAKQIQVSSINDVNCTDKSEPAPLDLNSHTSTSCSSDVVEVPADKSNPDLQEMLISENSESHDFAVANNLSQDPLEVDTSKNSTDVTNESINIPDPMSTPVPKKRGRPRKQPLSENAKPVTLPTPALEERPVRSLRLSRERPAILAKPRGRGRGRGAKRGNSSPQQEQTIDPARRLFSDEQLSDDIDPTSSRIKLPRMTEALDKSVCSTPLSSRRSTDLKLFDESSELKVVLEGISDMKSPEASSRGRGGRGRGRGRTPRGRGRARGGGKGAVYMKETMGIYGRVCGPATTTVELFGEETCMMDDNATPAKSSHTLDDDSQSSVKSSTNESNKMRKSKFADLFDSSKVWTAADVKEYQWPPTDTPDVKSQVMMVQEQVAMFLGVKSFKRRYPELVRRAIVGDEKDYLLSKGLVTEALCDLGITAVDASDVLDVMLSDYPHKYEEYRSHQRQRQIADLTEVNTNPEVRVEKLETKVEMKPEPPKVDPVKARQEMAAAAIASAAEFNSRLNSSRRPACVDLQSLTVWRRRAPPSLPAAGPAPAHLLYPHALLPGQYQHAYRVYEPDQLRYFPLNTCLAGPARAVSPASSSSDSDWPERSDSDSDQPTIADAKRKKLTKVKRSSKTDAESAVKEEAREEEEVELCGLCKLREDSNRKYPEKFLVCSTCHNKAHPTCLELGPDTARKARTYPWQCARCKTCLACSEPADTRPTLARRCGLCDRAAHVACVPTPSVPTGQWLCADCAVCKSCGSRSPAGPPQAGGPGQAGGPETPDIQWHHQTKRGPGGHKIFSHSLCTPCARAYRIGRYCPLCERSFIGPKGTMQLVICKLCDRQLHQDCVRQSVSNLNVMDYTCGECRRGGITSRAAAVRVAPRTIATLFMAKRRFNKYVHKQYMQSRRQKAAETDDAEPETVEEVLPDESCEPPEPSEGSASDPLEGVGNADETNAAVEALQRDFGD